MEKLQNIENLDENSDEINEFDEFDIMAARDWIKAIISNQDNRKALDKLNNQIQTVPTNNYIQMLTGIEMLADLLGAKIERVQSVTYFDYQGKLFFQL